MPYSSLSFNWIPAGDRATASSRLRCYVPHEQLLVHGIQSQIYGGLNNDLMVAFNPSTPQEVVVIQKRVTPEILEFALSAKSNGSRIIYDVDDAGDALWYWAHPKLCFKILKLADVVTTDTPERAAWLTRTMPGLNTAVWPNPIDYSPQQPTRLELGNVSKTTSGSRLPSPNPLPGGKGTSAEVIFDLNLNDREPLRVLWFGSTSTTSSLEKYASAIASMRQVQLVVCTGPEVNLKMEAEFVPWTMDSFISTLQGCDLVCLMHDGSKYDRMKSNHKMTTSICWGVPAVVSRTPDYERTANRIGIPEAVFENKRELVEAIERLRTKTARDNYLDRAQPKIWADHSPTSSANRLLAIVDQTTASKTSYQRKSYWERIHYAWWWTNMADSPVAAVRDLSKSLLSSIADSA